MYIYRNEHRHVNQLSQREINCFSRCSYITDLLFYSLLLISVRFIIVCSNILMTWGSALVALQEYHVRLDSYEVMIFDNISSLIGIKLFRYCLALMDLL